MRWNIIVISSPSRRCLISLFLCGALQGRSLVCSWRVPDIWRDISRGRLFPRLNIQEPGLLWAQPLYQIRAPWPKRIESDL